MDRVEKRTIIYPKRGAFQLVLEEILLSNGKRAEHMTLEHNGAVVILPVANDGSIVMIRQYRHSIGREILEFPAGTLKEGEDPSLCAERELSEETGYAARNFENLGVIYPAPGFCSEKQYLYLATDLYERSLPCDDDEEITVQNISIDEFYKALSSGEICDAKTIAIFMKAKVMGVV